MASKAAEKRYEAIGAISNATIETVIENDEVTNRLKITDTETVAAMIRDLAPLGRTERWQDAVEGWALLVEDQDTERGFEWAILQGGIYASHAAE